VVPPAPAAAADGVRCTCGAMIFPGAATRSVRDVASDPICASEFGAPPARAFAAEEPARGRDDEGDSSGTAASGPLRGMTARGAVTPPPAAGVWEPVGLPKDPREGLLFANVAAPSSAQFCASSCSPAGLRLLSTRGAGFPSSSFVAYDSEDDDDPLNEFDLGGVGI